MIACRNDRPSVQHVTTPFRLIFILIHDSMLCIRLVIACRSDRPSVQHVLQTDIPGTQNNNWHTTAVIGQPGEPH